jgi:Undecaprenyl-phosphate galactose phosphotransferase WbaP
MTTDRLTALVAAGPLRRRLRTTILLIGDLVVFPVAWVVAVSVSVIFGKANWSDVVPFSTEGGLVFTVMALLVVLALAVNGQYSRRAAFWEEVGFIWRYIAMAALINFALNFFIQVSYTRTAVLLAWCFALIALPICRLMVREALIRAGLWTRRALVVGDGSSARDTCKALLAERHMALEIVGVLGVGPQAEWARGFARVEAARDDDDDVEVIARELDCDVIVIALDESSRQSAARIAAMLHGQLFEVFVVPVLGGLPVHSMQPQYFFSNDILFLRLQHRLFSPVSRLSKRSIDILLSLTLLVLMSPLMAWVAWRIRSEDGSPALYTQKRMGLGGRDFDFVKFRSMVPDAEARLASWPQEDPQLYERYVKSNFKLADDPRLLRIGGLIRRLSIDELPQLWNVLRGDMSLVGPRPLLRRELGDYDADVMKLYAQVRPGVTGLWQVSGRSSTTFMQRAALDSWYVRNWSLWVDCVILIKTVRVVLSGRGAM